MVEKICGKVSFEPGTKQWMCDGGWEWWAGGRVQGATAGYGRLINTFYYIIVDPYKANPNPRNFRLEPPWLRHAEEVIAYNFLSVA